MPPVMPTFAPPQWQYMPGRVTVPVFAYPHGASSCPLVSAFVSRKSLAVNITASQVTEYGRFYTSYESQPRKEISETSEESIFTVGVLAVLWLMPFLLDSREANFLVKRTSMISRRRCALSSVHVVSMHLPCPLSAIIWVPTYISQANQILNPLDSLFIQDGQLYPWSHFTISSKYHENIRITIKVKISLQLQWRIGRKVVEVKTIRRLNKFKLIWGSKKHVGWCSWWRWIESRILQSKLEKGQGN